MKIKSLDFLNVAAQAASDKLGRDILALDVRKLTSIADYFLFVTGMSHLHVRALEDEIRTKVRDAGAELKRTDGQRGNPWRVLDFGDFIVHIMDHQTREFYLVERLWGQAKFIPLFEEPVKKKKSVKKVSRKSKKG